MGLLISVVVFGVRRAGELDKVFIFWITVYRFWRAKVLFVSISCSLNECMILKFYLVID